MKGLEDYEPRILSIFEWDSEDKVWDERLISNDVSLVSHVELFDLDGKKVAEIYPHDPGKIGIWLEPEYGYMVLKRENKGAKS